MEEGIDFIEVKEVNLYSHNLGRSDPGWINTSKETFKKNTWKDLFLLNWLVRLWLSMYWRQTQALRGCVGGCALPGHGLCMPSGVPPQVPVTGTPGHGDIPIIWLTAFRLDPLKICPHEVFGLFLNIGGQTVDIIPLTPISIRLLLYHINYSK